MKKILFVFFAIISPSCITALPDDQGPTVTLVSGKKYVMTGATESYVIEVSGGFVLDLVAFEFQSGNPTGTITYPHAPQPDPGNPNRYFFDVLWTGSGTINMAVYSDGGTRKNFLITVNKPPVGSVTISGGISSKCQGALNDTQHPFVASASNANSYSWSISSTNGNPGSISSSGSSAVVNWAHQFSGTATISVTAYGDSGSSTQNSTTVIVTPFGSVSFGAYTTVIGDGGQYVDALITGPICQYTSIKLKASGGTVGSYRLENENNPTVQHWEGAAAALVNFGPITETTTFRLDAIPAECAPPDYPARYLTVEVTPRPVVGSITPTLAPFCQGSRTTDSFVFSDPGNNSTSPTWSVSDSGAGTFSGNQMSWNPNFHGGVNIIVTVQGIGGCAGISNSGMVPVQVKPRPNISASPTDKCSGEGANFSLTSSTDNTFVETSISWSASGASASASPSSGNGTYLNPTLSNGTTESQTISFTINANQNGCTSTTNIPLSVKPRPSFTPDPTGSSSLCSEADAVVVLGSNVSGTTYKWSVSAPGVSGALEQSSYISVSEMRQKLTTGSTQNSATYTFTPQANGCPGNPAVVAFNVKPRPTLSLNGTNFTVCHATIPSPAIILSNPNNVSGTTYSWNAAANGISGISPSGSSSNGSALSIQYNLTNNSSPGSVYYSNIIASANGCPSPAQSLSVSVPSLATAPGGVTGNYRFQSGPLTVSVANASGSEQFKWSDSNDQNPVFANTHFIPNVTQNSANFSNVRRSVDGCWSQPRWFDVFVMPLPTITASQSFVVKSESVTLSTQQGYDSYVWNKSGGSSSPDDETFLTNQPGSYTVTVAKYGATGTSLPVALTNQLSGMDRNYIITNVAMAPNIVSFEGMNDQPKNLVTQSTQFFDGLGRLEQTVSTMASPSGKDVVQPKEIDAFGRETTKYLPAVAATATGHFYENFTGPVYGNSKHAEFYNGSTPAVPQDAAPYAKVAYDNSPLNRVVKEGAPGTAWQPVNELSLTDRTVKKRYLSNVENEVLKFDFDPASRLVSLAPVGSSNRFYAPNQLYVNVTYDEQQNDVTEYVDKNGRTICKKVRASATVYASTYYLYDEMDNLVVVLPPEAVKKFETGN